MTPGLWNLDPDDKSSQMIIAICSAVAAQEDLDNLHVTIAFDNRNPDNDIPLSTGTFEAVIAGVELFGPDDNILVLTLESEDLQAEHARIHANPYVNFDHIPYRPHITITKNSSEAELECLHNIIMSPHIPLLRITLGNQTREKAK